jgi:hypothetical protein
MNLTKTTIDDDSSPQRTSRIKSKSTHLSISPENSARITLNTHNSILSISEDDDDDEEDEGEGDTATATAGSVNNAACSTLHNPLQLQEVPAPLQQQQQQQQRKHHHLQRSSPSSCLMDNDDEEEEEEDGDDVDRDVYERDGSFFASSSLDLGVDHKHVVISNGQSNDHAEHDDQCSKNGHQVPLSSSVDKNDNASRSSSPPPPLPATKQTSSSTLATTANTASVQQQQNKTTPAISPSSCIPGTPPVCKRSWCGYATTATITPTPASGAIVVVTSPAAAVLVPPSIPIIPTTGSSIAQVPSSSSVATTDDSSAHQQPSQLPSTTILIKSPRGGGKRRGFFDAMTEHFVDSLCFPRDDSSATLQHTTCSSTSNAATETATPPTNSQSPPPPPLHQKELPVGSTPSNASAAAPKARDVPDPTVTSDVAAATGTGTKSSAQPSNTSHAICGSGSSSGDHRSLCLQDEFMVLLGCANCSSPNDDETQKVWAWNQSILECPRKETYFDDSSDSFFRPRAVTCGANVSLQEDYGRHHHRCGRRRPRRRTLHERAIRVHQLRAARGMPCYNKKPFLGRMKQMLFVAPPPSNTASISSTATSPTSVAVANSQMEWSSSRYQQQQKERTHYDNLSMMMDDSFHTGCVGTKGGNGDAIMKTCVPLRRSSRSMDDRILQEECKNDPLRKSKLEEHLNRRWAPIVDQDENDNMGYDSDPDGLDMYATATSATTVQAVATPQHSVVQNESQRQRMETALGMSFSSSSTSSSNSMFGQPPTPLWHANAVETVQESLNMSWNLTWHPGNNDDANGNNTNSRKIHIWIERGTIFNSAKVMLEPNLMWRDFYQPEMSKQRKLNVCIQKRSQTQAASATTIPPQAVVNPYTIRLLSVCRVLEAPLLDALDRSLYPLARPSCSFLLKTAAPDCKEYLFEAATSAERDAIVHRWKACIARFAALAVMEDLDAICREFFVPAITSRMLVPDDYHWEEY